MQIGSSTVENSMEAFLKLMLKLSKDSAIPLCDIYGKEMKTGVQRDIYIPMIIATLFTIANMWKNLNVRHLMNVQSSSGLYSRLSINRNTSNQHSHASDNFFCQFFEIMPIS